MLFRRHSGVTFWHLLSRLNQKNSARSKDRLTPEQRGAVMRAIHSRDTKPELTLRRALWHAGLRYRVHCPIAGATPDICFLRQKVAIFVDGCFWHGCPRHYVPPSGNAVYWTRKIRRTQTRDARDTIRLQAAGFAVLRFWECEVWQEIDSVIELVKRTCREHVVSPRRRV
jgi:DNA mismatch endonuclease (patch repair protein)